MRLLALLDSVRVPPPVRVMVLPLVPPRIRSVKLPVEPMVSVPAMSSEPAPAPPAIVRLSPLLRLAESAAPIVRLAIVGAMSMRTGLFVALLIVTLALVEFGTVFGVQLAAVPHRSLTLPFQVWASAALGQLRMSPDRSNTGKIDAILPSVALDHDPPSIDSSLFLRLLNSGQEVRIRTGRLAELPSYFDFVVRRSSHSWASLRKMKTPGASSADLEQGRCRVRMSAVGPHAGQDIGRVGVSPGRCRRRLAAPSRRHRAD